METGKVITLVVASIVALAVGTYLERMVSRKHRPRFLLPVRSPVVRFLLALMVGIAATFFVHPWNSPLYGWSLWQAALFIAGCFFGPWLGMTLRYWAYRMAQDRDQRR